MQDDRKRRKVPIPEKERSTVKSLIKVMSIASLELERHLSQTLQKTSTAKMGQIIINFPGGNEPATSIEITYDDGTQACTDHEAEVCCTGPCPC